MIDYGEMNDAKTLNDKHIIEINNIRIFFYFTYFHGNGTAYFQKRLFMAYNRVLPIIYIVSISCHREATEA